MYYSTRVDLYYHQILFQPKLCAHSDSSNVMACAKFFTTDHPISSKNKIWLIGQGSSHRGHRWRVFQVLKVMIVRWDGFVRKVGLFSALFSEIDAFWLEGLESANPPTFFVFASLGCTFCSPIDQAQNFGMECGLLVIVIFVEMSSDRVGSSHFDVI